MSYNDKKIVGFTCSTWDLLHSGHILMLKEAKTICDYLIVGLHNDPTIDRKEKNKPVQSIIERYFQLRAVRYVEEIIVYNTEKDLEDLLKFIKIDVRILGEEYKDVNFTGREYCEKSGIKLFFNKREHGFSSSELRVRVFNSEMEKMKNE